MYSIYTSELAVCSIEQNQFSGIHLYNLIADGTVYSIDATTEMPECDLTGTTVYSPTSGVEKKTLHYDCFQVDRNWGIMTSVFIFLPGTNI